MSISDILGLAVGTGKSILWVWVLVYRKKKKSFNHKESCITLALLLVTDMFQYADGRGGWLTCKNRSVSWADHHRDPTSARTMATGHLLGPPVSPERPASHCIINLNWPLSTWSVTLIRQKTFTEKLWKIRAKVQAHSRSCISNTISHEFNLSSCLIDTHTHTQATGKSTTCF